MERAVEIPQEANPLNSQTLYNVLIHASSTNQYQIQSGTKQLQNWESYPGFYSGLQTIFISTSLPFDIRYLSAIQLKNGIDKYWRKTAVNAISKKEKALIRERCLESGMNEPDPRIALQIALIIAKITRFEFPHDWPDAISSVAQQLRLASRPEANSLYLSRALLILLYIIKELATGRLQRTRANLQTAAPEVFQVLGKVYVEKANIWMKSIGKIGEHGEATSDDLEQSFLALRVLRRLLVAGYEHPNRHTEIQEFWGLLNQQFGEITPHLSQYASSFETQRPHLMESHLVQISKLHLEMVRVHPAAFILLLDSVLLIQAYWDFIVNWESSQGLITSSEVEIDAEVPEEYMTYTERVSLKGLLLLRGCAKMVYSPTQTFKYQHNADKEERKQAIEMVKSTLLSENMINLMMETLVSRFFVLRPKDVRGWQEEPEEWERREDGEGDVWEFSIRLCAEKLFLDIVINNKDLLIQPLLNVFHKAASIQLTDVLLKDSIYAAIGLAAPVLDQHLDFATFLESTLVPEVQIQGAGSHINILRRRIALLLGQWTPIKEGLNRPLIYQIFQFLLDKDDKINDIVVRVTAGRQLKNVIDPWEFAAEDFMPFASALLGRIMALIEEVDLPETKMALLSTISAIVVKMEHHIIPFADQIISLLPPLWTQQADNEYLMKQSILTILAALINSMKGESLRYHQMILPLIESTVQPESKTGESLLEDALDLWGAILVQTPEPTPGLLNLVQYLLPMLRTASETLRKALEITESYVLLVPQAFFQTDTVFLVRFLSAFAALFNAQVKREANGTTTRLLELLIRATSTLGGVQGCETLTKHLHEAQLLSTLLAGLKTAHDAHQTTGPNRIHSNVDGIIETDYFSVLARLAIAHSPTFIIAISHISTTCHESFDQTIEWLLTEWFSHLENIGTASKKKLMCLALTAILESHPKAWALKHLQSFMTAWTDVITECVGEPEEGEQSKDNLVYWDPEGLKPEWPEAPEDTRNRDMVFSDPVHRIDIRTYIRDNIQSIVAACGGPEAFERDWLVNVDRDVVHGFQTLGIL